MTKLITIRDRQGLAVYTGTKAATTLRDAFQEMLSSGLKPVDLNLKGFDLSFLELSHQDFSGSDLTNAYLNGARIESCNFTRASLNGATLKAARIEKSNFSGAAIIHADLADATIQVSNFGMSDFTKSLLNGARISMSDFTAAKMQDIEMVGTKFNDSCMRGVALQNAYMLSATFKDCRFLANLMDDARLIDCKFNDCQLEGLHADTAVLTNTVLVSETRKFDPASLRVGLRPDGDLVLYDPKIHPWVRDAFESGYSFHSGMMVLKLLPNTEQRDHALKWVNDNPGKRVALDNVDLPDGSCAILFCDTSREDNGKLNLDTNPLVMTDETILADAEEPAKEPAVAAPQP